MRSRFVLKSCQVVWKAGERRGCCELKNIFAVVDRPGGDTHTHPFLACRSRQSITKQIMVRYLLHLTEMEGLLRVVWDLIVNAIDKSAFEQNADTTYGKVGPSGTKTLAHQMFSLETKLNELIQHLVVT